ncbi:MAG TPA: TetR/AcrR family transcriptional regulator [Solirubrobacteraceae bacterium]
MSARGVGRASAQRRTGLAEQAAHRSRRRSEGPGGAVASRQGQSIVALQRSRLIDAAVGLLAAQGYEAFSAAAVCERAGVSRRTFYEVFEGRDACLVALLEYAEERIAKAFNGMDLASLAWSERIRMGLWAILCIADSDPALARVCLVESQRAGASIQLERERMTGRLVAFIDEGRSESASASKASELTAEALFGAVTSVIAARLKQPAFREEKDGAPRAGVRGLLGELTAMIALPYLGTAVAQRERKRPLPSATAVETAQTGDGAGAPNPLVDLPMRLTYRTARILLAAAALTADGAGASNRQIAEHAGISDPGQASKLLSRLQDHGLLQNATQHDPPRGEANSWRLTANGQQLLHAITARGASHASTEEAVS